METTESPQSLLVRGYQWISEGANAWTLFGLSGIGGLVGWLLPLDWMTPAPWLLTVCAFSGTWAAVQAVSNGVRRVNRRVKPSRLELTADSGTHGCVGLVHRGSPTTITATGRIVRFLNGDPNPSPHRFECRLSRGGKGELSRRFTDGDWAHIIVASEGTESHGHHGDDCQHDGLLIHRGETVVKIPDSGAEVEIEFKASPPLDGDAAVFTRRFTAKWTDGIAEIVKLDVT